MTDASSAIARLRELRAKATAGPWERSDSTAWVGTYDNRGEPVQERVAETGNEPDAAAIVAAMNSLDALLECAEALAAHVAAEDEALAEWPLLSVHPWTGDEPAMRRLAKARAALEALGKVGGA